MKTVKHYCFWSTAILLCSGCLVHFDSKVNHRLQGSWRLSDVTPLQVNAKHTESFEEQADEKRLVNEGMVFNFFDDGTYTELSRDGRCVSGHWRYSNADGILVLSDSGKTKASPDVKMDENEFKKEILTMDVADENTELHFIKEAAPIKDFLSDPFYPANNLWRRKPARHESEKELTNRFAAYLKHVALILKAVRERKQDVVSFQFSEGPIQIYNGGIGIYSFSTVPDSWKACFFDDADALRAYDIYWKYLSTHRFNGAATGNWTEDDYNILLSIYSGLQTAKAKDLH